MADVLGEEVTLIAERDTSAAGAAILGRAAEEAAEVTEIAESCVRIERRFEPCPSDQEPLTQAFKRYRAYCARLFSDGI